MKKPVLTVKAVSRYMRPDASRLLSPLTRRPLGAAAGGRHAGEAAQEGAHVLLQHALPAARLHVALPSVRAQPAARNLHGGARARLPQLRRGEQGGDSGLLGAGGDEGEAGGAHPPDQRREQNVGEWEETDGQLRLRALRGEGGAREGAHSGDAHLRRADPQLAVSHRWRWGWRETQSRRRTSGRSSSGTSSAESPARRSRRRSTPF